MQGHIQAVWETGIPVCAPKLKHPNKTFEVCFLQSNLNKKSIKVFQYACNYFEMVYKTKVQTKEKNNEAKGRQSQRRNCLQKLFHLFKT